MPCDEELYGKTKLEFWAWNLKLERSQTLNAQFDTMEVYSLNGKFRNECLNQHWFRTLDEAKYEIDLWREHYNHVRPHSSLNYLPPVEYAKQAA